MKKITFFAIVFVSLCSMQKSIIAEEQVAADQTEAASSIQFEDAAKQHRYVRTQVFVNLLQKVQNSPEDASKFIAYTLDWMQELSQSNDAADQELYRQLYALIRSICVEITSESAAQENQEDKA